MAPFGATMLIQIGGRSSATSGQGRVAEGEGRGAVFEQLSCSPKCIRVAL